MIDDYSRNKANDESRGKLILSQKKKKREKILKLR